jgi:integral membrane protein (TIGR01906 family)
MARPSLAARVVPGLIAIAIVLISVGVGLLAAANPWYIHGALDRSGSADLLGLPLGQVHLVSDATVTELFIGPGTFAQTFTDPGTGESTRFYGPTEASHLRDAQLLARLLVAAVALSAVGLVAAALRTRDRAWLWRSVSRGAVATIAGVAIVGVFFAIAFEPAFTLFHEVFFPQGNWSFDPLEARMVQLYNEAFWNEIVLVFAGAAIGAAIVLWLVARARLRVAVAEHT